MKRKILFSVFDTAVLSAMNFSLGLILINFASKHEYGVYTLFFTVLMLAVGFQNAFITTQLTVKGAKKNLADKQKFGEALFGLQYVIGLFLAIVVLVLLSVFSSLFDSTLNILVLMTFILITILGTYGREYLRSHQYLYHNPNIVFVIDLAYVLLVILFMLVYLTISESVTAFLVMLGIGLSSIIVTVYFSVKLKVRPSFKIRNIKKAFLEVLPNGSWAMGGVSLSWLQSNTYAYLVSILLNPSATAELAAGRLLLMPVNLLSEAVYRIFKPRWAALVDNDFSAVYASTFKVMLTILSLLLIYFIPVWYFWDLFIPILFSESYIGIFNIALLWAGVFLVQIIRSRYSQLLQVLEEFEYLTKLNIPSAIVTIIFSAILTLLIGANGALIGVIIGELLLVFLLSKRVMHVRSRN